MAPCIRPMNPILVLVHAKWCPHCPTRNKVLRDAWNSVKRDNPHAIDVEEAQLTSPDMSALREKVEFYPSLFVVMGDGSLQRCQKPLTETNMRAFYRRQL